MGKHLLTRQQGVHFNDNTLGCMWGIFHIIDYPHWRHVKKMFPHGWHHGRKHAIYARKNILGNYIDEALDSESDELEPLLVRQVKPMVTSPKKSSERNKDVSVGMHLFCPKHCLVPSDYCVSCSSNSGNTTNATNRRHTCSQSKTPQELLGTNRKRRYYSRHTRIFVQDHQDVWNFVFPIDKDTKLLTGYQKLVDPNKHNEEISNEVEEYRDFLEVPKLKKDMLLRILQDLDVNKKTSHLLKASNSNAKLMKSVSYPVSRSSGPRVTDKHVSMLKHKHTEIWLFPKGDKLKIASQADNAFSSNDAPDNVLPVQTVNDDSVVASAGDRRIHKFSLGTSLGLNHQNWNQMVVHRFKMVKQKIKHALMEFKKDRRQNSAEEIDKFRLKKEAQSINDGNSQDCKESADNFRRSNENWDSDLSKLKASSYRRPCSMNDSLDRYTDLFERSFGKDKRWHNSKSKSFKLVNEDNDQIKRFDSKSHRRNFSLPDHDLLNFFLYEPTFDRHDSLMPVKTSLANGHEALVPVRNSADSLTTSVRLSGNTDKPADAIVESGHRNADKESSHSNMSFCSSSVQAMTKSEPNEGIAEAVDDLRDDKHMEEALTGSPQQANKEIESLINPSTKLIERAQEAVSFENKHQESCTIYKEDRGSIPSFVDLTYQRTNLEDFETASKCQEEHSLSSKFYLKDIWLQLQYTWDELSGIWNTTKDPLKQSLLREVQALLVNEYEFSGDNIGCLSHPLLIDLLNEVLLDMQERFSTQFPRTLSSNCRIRPIPKGHRLLEEVWMRLNSYLRLRPELDQSLDDVVGRDFAEDSWMKLRLEIECLTVELEDMIFQELFGIHGVLDKDVEIQKMLDAMKLELEGKEKEVESIVKLINQGLIIKESTSNTEFQENIIVYGMKELQSDIFIGVK